MKLNQLLQLVELRLGALDPPLRVRMPDRLVLREYANHSIARHLEMEQWSWGVAYLNPMISVAQSRRDYMLPRDFGGNFLLGGKDGLGYTIKLSDSSNDSELIYERPEIFFDRGRTGATEGTPTHYTITSQGGRRMLHLDPPPDGSYTVTGAYRPIWDGSLVEEEDELPVPNHSVILYDVLLQVQGRPEWQQMYVQALQALYMEEARSSKPKISPAYSDRSGYSNEYEALDSGGGTR